MSNGPNASDYFVMPKERGVKTYYDLDVWVRAMELAEMVYKISGRFPRSEQFGLTDQARRAAVSIASNIAEGNARNHLAAYLNYLTIARGSKAELETQILLAHRLNYLDKESMTEFWELSNHVGRLLNGLITSLRRSTHH